MHERTDWIDEHLSACGMNEQKQDAGKERPLPPSHRSLTKADGRQTKGRNESEQKLFDESDEFEFKNNNYLDAAGVESGSVRRSMSEAET